MLTLAASLDDSSPIAYMASQVSAFMCTNTTSDASLLPHRMPGSGHSMLRLSRCPRATFDEQDRTPCSGACCPCDLHLFDARRCCSQGSST